MRIVNLLYSLLLRLLVSTPYPKGTRQAIIIDTDLFSDADDAGAITIANVLHNCGLADLKGIVLNTQSKYGAVAASSICTYFGNGAVPVAARRPLSNETFFDSWQYVRGEFVSKVGYNWPGSLTDASTAPTPVELYRTLLSSATVRSLHIISTGFLVNLEDLLKSTGDHISPLPGPDLLEAKVSELIVMGGMYPSGWEYNFGGPHLQSAIYVLKHWPKSIPMTYSGAELGGNIYSGRNVKEKAPPDSPTIAAYEWYVGRCSIIRETWDPITTLYGALGLHGFAKLGIKPLLKFGNKHGYNSINTSSGTNAWVNNTSVTNQHWLSLADGVTNVTMAALIDNFLIHYPNNTKCLQ